MNIKIKKFENIVYDTDYVEEVEKVISAIDNSGLKKLRTHLELYPLNSSHFTWKSEQHLSVSGLDEDGEDLFIKLNKFIKGDFFQNWIESEDFKYYAFLLDIGNMNARLEGTKKILNCYFTRYMPVESDGDEAQFISESYLEYQYKINKSLFDLLKNLSNIGYKLYKFSHIYIIVKMKYLKPYNESLDIPMQAYNINVDLISTFDPDDIIDALEIDNIEASKVSEQHYKKFIDSNGNEIRTFNNKNINQDIFIKHEMIFLINIFKTSDPISNVGCLFRQPISITDFNDFIISSKVTVEKFEKVCKRVASLRDSKMELKVNMFESNIDNIRNIQLRFHLSIIEKDPVDIKELYNKWKKSFIVISVDNAIKKLKMLYRSDGMEDPPIDINEEDLSDDTDSVMIGFFTDDEIIVVGLVNKKTGALTVDKKEYLRSFQQF